MHVLLTAYTRDLQREEPCAGPDLGGSALVASTPGTLRSSALPRPRPEYEGQTKLLANALSGRFAHRALKVANSAFFSRPSQAEARHGCPTAPSRGTP